MKISEFDYSLPENLIAQNPIEPRDSSRLMIIDRTTGKFEHRIFRDLPHYLSWGDCLVLNDTRVLPARLRGYKAKTKGKVEVLLLQRVEDRKWEALVKPGRKLPPGVDLIFGDGLLLGHIEERLPGGGRIISFECQGDFKEVLNRIGEVPLPPYIHETLEDKERYQTIYARREESIAAPTAGLHFTPSLLKDLERKGVRFVFVTLQVELDTFRPVRVENVEEHKIHSEYFQLSQASAELINRTINEGKRVIAVGTTSARTLETVAVRSPNPESPGSMGRKWRVGAGKGWTELFIYPGFDFKIVDALITNFHLPKSTTLILVSAFAGRDLIIRAYREAIDRGYRFLSFGDAMLIL